MHVLVSVASKHGATAEIGQWIGKELAAHGLTVSVVDPDEVADVSPYDAVVLGSAVYAGHWLGPAKELVERCAGDLPARPVWLFSSGPVGDPPMPDEEAVDVADMVTATGARDHEVFAGRIDRKNLGFAERAIVRALKVPEGDFRDSEATTAWARHIAAELDATPARVSSPDPARQD